MAIDIFMYVKGQRQGVIEGDATGTGHAGWIQLLDLKWAAEQPLDISSGLPTGKQTSQPLLVSGETGRHTSNLLQAFTDNENLTTVKIELDRTNGSGQSTTLSRIELTNASLTSFETNVMTSQATSFDNYAFTFQKLTFTWLGTTNPIISTTSPTAWDTSSNATS